eukprot:1782459-Amphidinium_carterae.1
MQVHTLDPYLQRTALDRGGGGAGFYGDPVENVRNPAPNLKAVCNQSWDSSTSDSRNSSTNDSLRFRLGRNRCRDS